MPTRKTDHLWWLPTVRNSRQLAVSVARSKLPPTSPDSRTQLHSLPQRCTLARSCTLAEYSLHSLTQLHSLHASALSPRSCTLTALLAAQSHAAALSHSCLSRSWTLAHSCTLSRRAVLSLLSHTAALSHIAALRLSHSCTRCTLTRSCTLSRRANSDCRTLGCHSLPHIIICCAGFGSLRNRVEWSHGGLWWQLAMLFT